MKKKLYFLGAPYEVSNEGLPNTRYKFEYTGKNTGNLLIGYGLRNILRADTYRFGSRGDTPEWVRETFDAIVVSAANFIFRGFNFGYLADFIEQTDLPVLVAGLGAQASHDGFDIKQVPEGTLRFVRAAADRSHSIAVRGVFSAEVVASLGVENIRVLGCPSLLTTRAHEIQIRRPSPENINICLNGSRNVVSHSFDPESALRVERGILEYAVRNNIPYVYQNEDPEYLICSNEYPEYADAQLSEICRRLKANVTPEEFKSYISSQGNVFFSVESWMKWIRKFDFVMGTRFHGNMVAVLAGIPAMVLTHDSRTKEMCETICFPSVSITDVETFDPHRLIELADFDRFEKRYIEIRNEFSCFFEENGFEHYL